MAASDWAELRREYDVPLVVQISAVSAFSADGTSPAHSYVWVGRLQNAVRVHETVEDVARKLGAS